jgi:hypothetical protein
MKVRKEGALIARFVRRETYQLVSDCGSLAECSRHLLGFPLSFCNDIDNVSGGRGGNGDLAFSEQAREKRNVHYVLLLCRRHLVLRDSPFGWYSSIESCSSLLADFFPSHVVVGFQK